MTAGAGSPSRRVVLIEFLADTDSFTKHVDEAGIALDKMTEQVKHTSEESKHFGAQLDKKPEKLLANNKSTQSLIGSIAILGAAYYTLRASIQKFIMEGDRLSRQLGYMRGMMQNASKDADAMAVSFGKAGLNVGAMMSSAERFQRVGVGGEHLEEAAESARKMSYIFDMSIEQTSAHLADFARAFGLPTDQVDNLASSMAALHYDMGVSQAALTSISKEAVSAASQLKLPAESLFTVASAFERAGAAGAEAGHLASTLFSRLADPAISRELTLMGLNVDDLTERMRTDVPGAMMDLAKAIDPDDPFASRFLAGLDTREAQILMNMANIEADIKDFNKTASDAFADSSALARVFDEATRDLGSQLRKLGEQVTEFGQSMGRQLAPMLAFVVYLFRGVFSVLNAMPDSFKAAIGVTFMLFTALVGIPFILAKIITFLKIQIAQIMLSTAVTMKNTLTTLLNTKAIANNAFATKMLTLARSFYAKVEAFATLVQKEGLIVALTKVKAYIAAKLATIALTAVLKIQTAIYSLHTAAMNRNKLALFTLTAAKKSAQAATFLYGKAILGLLAVKKLLTSGAIATAASFVGVKLAAAGAAVGLGILKAAIAAVTVAKAIFTAVFLASPIGWIALAVMAVVAAFYGLYKMLTSSSETVRMWGKIILATIFPVIGVVWLLYKAFKYLWDNSGAIFKGIADGFKWLGNVISAGFLWWWGNVKAFWTGVRDLFSAGLSYITNLWASVWGGLIWLFNKAKEGFSSVIQFFSNAFDYAANIVEAAVSHALFPLELFGNALSWLGDVAKMPFQLIASGWNRVTGLARSAIDPVIDLGKATYEYVTKPIQWAGDAYNWFGNTISNMVSSVTTVFRNLWGAIRRGVQPVIDGFNWILDKMGAIGDAAGWVYSKLFGSGLFHIVEGSAEAEIGIGGLTSRMYGMHSVFSVLRAGFAALVQDIREVPKALEEIASPDDIAFNATVGRPSPVVAPVAAAVSRAMRGAVQHSQQTTVVTAQGTGGSEPKGARVTSITVPVTLVLDGESIGQAVAYVSEEDLIRHHNSPILPYRGVPEVM